MADKWGFQKTLQALALLSWWRSILGGDEIEGLGIAGIREEMAEARIEFAAVLLGPHGDRFGNLSQGEKVRGRIAIPPSVVGDDVQTTLKQDGEFVFHGHLIADAQGPGNCGIDAGRIAR